MTAATLPDGYTLAPSGSTGYTVTRDGRTIGHVWQRTDGTWWADGRHYLLTLPATGPAHPGHRQLEADTAGEAATMLARFADVLAALAADLAPYRDTAAAWHGGQFSALYALASRGVVVEPWQLAREAARADREAFDAATGDDLPADA